MLADELAAQKWMTEGADDMFDGLDDLSDALDENCFNTIFALLCVTKNCFKSLRKVESNISVLPYISREIE